MAMNASATRKLTSGTPGSNDSVRADKNSFHVFLSYGRTDAQAVEVVAARLEDEAGLHPFLDAWHLIPGEPWQEELEAALDHSQTCAVFFGPAGLGPWENEEMRSALDARVKQPDFRVIPVLLPGATMPERGVLPRFLSRLTWVDFRGSQGLQDPNAFGRLLAGIRGEPPGRPRGVAVTLIVECPYRGLQAFDEEDARFFFGREAVVQQIIEALRSTRFLAVVGPSGSGKSSVVRAGLLSHLRAGALPASAGWHYFVLKPGSHPLEELALNLTRNAPNGPTPTQILDLIENGDERALHLAVRLLADQAREVYCLIIDQFEEVFTLCTDRDERIRFINLLRYAATIAGGQAIIVITMRADFLARAAEYADLGELLSGNQFIISPMDEEDLRRAIEEPARRAGAQFEPGLVDAIIRDAGSEPGVLPLMEHALWQLWQQRGSDNRLTLHFYNEIGGLKGALAGRADEIFDSFSPEQQAIARRILLRLTQPGEGTEDTRRRAAMSELETAVEEKLAIEEVLHTLTDARLLVSDKDQVDVAHEALIRGWPRLHKWIDEDRTALRFHHRITEAAQEWQRLERDDGALFRGASLAQAQEWREHHGQDLNPLEREFLDASVELKQRQERVERERQQRELEAERQRATQLRWFASGLGVVTVLAIVAGLIAWRQRGRAIEQVRIAALDLLVAEARSSINSHPDLALLLAATAATQPPNIWEARDTLLTALQSEPDLKTFLTGYTSYGSVAFSPDGKTLASASLDKTIRLWDVMRHQRLGAPLTGHPGPVESVVFSPVESVAFSPDGKTLASASLDKTIRLWDVTRRQPLGAPLTGHTEAVYSVAFSPDGKTLASASADNTVRLWDVTRRQPLGAPLTGHTEAVYSVAFSPDGKTLASASYDKTRSAVGCDAPPPAGRAAHRPYELRVERGVQPGWQDSRFGQLGQHRSAVGCNQPSAARRAAHRPYGHSVWRGVQPRWQDSRFG
jgi:energy-coupling factor transporter ATP-binding protein EcfA2